MEGGGGFAMPPLSPLLTAPLACTAISGEAVPTYLPPSPPPPPECATGGGPAAYLPTLLHEWFGPQPTAGASQSEVGNPLSDVIVCRCREIYLLTFDECVL